MNSQQLLFLNFIIFIVFVLFFLVKRPKARQPVKLAMKNTGNDTKNLVQMVNVPKTTEPQESFVGASKVELKQAVSEIQSFDEPNSRELQAKEVNISSTSKKTVYFMFNGHEWNAFEVLGVPKSSNLLEVTAHYQNLIKTADPSTFEFYDAAYTAILKKR